MHMIDLVYQPQPFFLVLPKQHRVLIVDDDEAMADVLSHRLQQQGFDPLWADCGEAGVAIARAERPSVILLDLRLPDTDGLAVCQQLADSSETCGIPVIILSGLDRPDIVRRCRSSGCRFFLRKPHDPNVLLVLIHHLIAEGHSA